MPWKETVVSDQRMAFVLACRQTPGESMAELCRQFGISRKTGYKWEERYLSLGPEGLCDRSRAPHFHPNAVEQELHERIVELRLERPTWGPRKLLAYLGRRDPQLPWPSASTAGEILKREGLSVPRKKRPRAELWADPLGEIAANNRVWCADFKGWFVTGDGRRCDPLTVMDGFSRYLLRCQAVRRMDFVTVRGQFEATFREYGLPEAIRTDNGEPFASTGVAGLSRLSVWWVRLGIVPQRIEPGEPQQNGRHERMHLTLEQDTASPPAPTWAGQGRRLKGFTWDYNHHRPHEALSMATPASVYSPSRRPYPARLAELEYPGHHQLRRVDEGGNIRWKGSKVFIGKALDGQVVGLEELDGRLWRVRFGPIDLGVMDEKSGGILPRWRQKRIGL